MLILNWQMIIKDCQNKQAIKKIVDLIFRLTLRTIRYPEQIICSYVSKYVWIELDNSHSL